MENKLKEKRGRDLFTKYKYIINIVIFLFKISPRFLRTLVWNASNLSNGKLGVGIRYCILKNLAKSCGENIYIGRYVQIKHCSNLIIGNNVSVHDFCYIDAQGNIVIEDNVSIAHHTSLVSFNHTWGNEDLPIKDNPLILGPIVIHEDVWVGAGSRILSGVTINRRSVVAAGAVVVKDILPATIVGGIPAKFIKSIGND
ncbi:acyltransferase [Terribacillus saccharophilus]|uniref:acyltransferase n=1 Tax=Terribacillus saccharophilus TaxID=361277 RepID=UPI003982ABCD